MIKEWPKNIWVKSPFELEREKTGHRLFSNYDPAFSLGGFKGLFKELQEYEKEQGKDFVPFTHRVAYDKFTRRIPNGKSMYIDAPELITDSAVVLRDWETLQDEEYKGNVEEILRMGERLRASNEESLKEIRGILNRV